LTRKKMGLVLCACLSIAGAVHAEETPQGKRALASLPADTEVAYIVVKFRDDAGVRMGPAGKLMQKGAGASAAATPLATSLRAIEARALGNRLTVRRHFAEQTEAQIDELMAEARKQGPERLADLNSYYSMRLPRGTRFADVAALVQSFGADEFVEVAYAAPVPQPAQVPATPNFETMQGYLDAPPNGINARWAWRYPGALGDQVRIVDIEQAWNPLHEDFPTLFHDSGNYDYSLANNDDHGTAVVGVLAARHNGIGTSGIVPNAQIGVRAVNNSWNVAQGIATASFLVGVGGIILVEQHAPGPSDGTACTCNFEQCNFLPMEYWSAEYSATRAATQAGRVVVAAAGNGSVNLDAPAYGNRFNRNERDSGAIIVGASLSTSRTPACFTNYGSRVDMHGWGENVATLGYGGLFYGEWPGNTNRLYTGWFSGTSSASPIVAGAVAIIQGVRRAQGLPTSNSVGMRYLLSTNGTPQSGDLSRPIGSLPDVRAAMMVNGLVPPPPDLPWLPVVLDFLLSD
jgi:serine protease